MKPLQHLGDQGQERFLKEEEEITEQDLPCASQWFSSSFLLLRSLLIIKTSAASVRTSSSGAEHKTSPPRVGGGAATHRDLQRREGELTGSAGEVRLSVQWREPRTGSHPVWLPNWLIQQNVSNSIKDVIKLADNQFFLTFYNVLFQTHNEINKSNASTSVYINVIEKLLHFSSGGKCFSTYWKLL